MNPILQEIADKITAKAIASPDPAKILATDLAAILNNIVNALPTIETSNFAPYDPAQEYSSAEPMYVSYETGGQTNVYQYINPTPATGILPTDTTYWQFVSPGQFNHIQNTDLGTSSSSFILQRNSQNQDMDGITLLGFGTSQGGKVTAIGLHWFNDGAGDESYSLKVCYDYTGNIATDVWEEMNFYGNFQISSTGNPVVRKYDTFEDAIAALEPGENLLFNTNQEYLDGVTTQVLTLPSGGGIYFNGLPQSFDNTEEFPDGAVIACAGNARINGGGSEITTSVFDTFISHTAAGSVYIEHLAIKANGVNNVLNLLGGVTAKYYLYDLHVTNTAVSSFGGTLDIKRQFEIRNSYFNSPSCALNANAASGTVENTTLVIDGDEGFNNFVNSSITFSNSRLIGRNNGTAYDRLIIIQDAGTYVFDNCTIDAGGAQYAILCTTGGTLPTVILRGNTTVVGEISGVTLVDERTSGTIYDTGTALTFRHTGTKYYGSMAAPETGNITADLTGAVVGSMGVMFHNAGVEPTLSGSGVTFNKIGGDYQLGQTNRILLHYVGSSTIDYAIR